MDADSTSVNPTSNTFSIETIEGNLNEMSFTIDLLTFEFILIYVD